MPEEELLEISRSLEPFYFGDKREQELLAMIKDSHNQDAVESAKASLFSEKGLHYK